MSYSCQRHQCGGTQPDYCPICAHERMNGQMSDSMAEALADAGLADEIDCLRRKLAESEAANAAMREAIKNLYEEIAHGNEDHRYWLKTAIGAYFAKALASDSGSKLLSRLRALEAVAAAAKRLNRVSPAIIFAEEKAHADAMFHELRDALAKLDCGGEGGE